MRGERGPRARQIVGLDRGLGAIQQSGGLLLPEISDQNLGGSVRRKTGQGPVDSRDRLIITAGAHLLPGVGKLLAAGGDHLGLTGGFSAGDGLGLLLGAGTRRSGSGGGGGGLGDPNVNHRLGAAGGGGLFRGDASGVVGLLRDGLGLDLGAQTLNRPVLRREGR